MPTQLTEVFLLRCNGALIAICSTESKALDYMRISRKNGEYWRIERKPVL